MAEYTAFVEAGNALVELLRENLTPEPISKKELISLCSPHEAENNQLTVYMFQMEEDVTSAQNGYYQVSRDMQRMSPAQFTVSFLITAHSKAPAQMKEADQYRMIGAVVQVLKDNPTLGRPFLTGSLEETGAELRVSIERPTFDQLIKIWNNTSSPYKLSLVVKLSGISIDSRRYRKVGRVTDVQIGLDRKKEQTP